MYILYYIDIISVQFNEFLELNYIGQNIIILNNFVLFIIF